MKEISYQVGFGNDFSTEALKGALPIGRNSPQKPAYGLYPEQFSSSAFTEPRQNNMRSWFYRIRPSVLQGEFVPYGQTRWKSAPLSDPPPSPTPYRWDPMPKNPAGTDFVDGLFTVAANGSAAQRAGSAVLLYDMNKSMDGRFIYNADGEMLIVPQKGDITIRTEQGAMSLSPTYIGVIPRGLKFQVVLDGDHGSGYVLENYGAPLKLPNLGPIGANGLAQPRDFESPVAAYEEVQGDFTLIAKFGGHLFKAPISHSPFDVVAWHGNSAPYRYDLKRFNTINTVSFDHPDPSIFTVLTSPTNTPGMANIDFVIFPPRWMVAEDTFRPPYYHRNIMSEYMGLIEGVYDAKTGGGFQPGGGSLHNCMTAHGPDGDAAKAAIHKELGPSYQANTLAFMFESSLIYHATKAALNSGFLQQDYLACWQDIEVMFQRER